MTERKTASRAEFAHGGSVEARIAPRGRSRRTGTRLEDGGKYWRKSACRFRIGRNNRAGPPPAAGVSLCPLGKQGSWFSPVEKKRRRTRV